VSQGKNAKPVIRSTNHSSQPEVPSGRRRTSGKEVMIKETNGRKRKDPAQSFRNFGEEGSSNRGGKPL